MKKIVLSCIGFSLLGTTLFGAATENRDRQQSVKQLIGQVAKPEQKEISIVDEFRHMFEAGKVTGQLRSMYMEYNEQNSNDTYATALGGMLKYELAEFNGFGGGVAFRTTQNVSSLSGDGDRYNAELSGTDKHYTAVTEAYIQYNYENISVNLGREGFDTPLMDTDEIRMVPNSFEAYTLAYEQDGFSLLGGYVDRWQGDDAGLENGWVKMGKNGVAFVGFSYDGEIVETNAWYYNFSNASQEDIANGADANGNNAYYVDLGAHYHINKDMHLHGVVQYLREDEIDNSGVEAEIYGATAEVVFKDLGLNVGYNESAKKENKHSFSGYGGGYLFTSMDTMILDEITEDRRAYSWVCGASYAFGDMNFLYAYGDFKGDADSNGLKAHITEQNIGFEYTHKEELTVAALYVIDRNKEESNSDSFNNDNFRILVAYNF